MDDKKITDLVKQWAFWSDNGETIAFYTELTKKALSGDSDALVKLVKWASNNAVCDSKYDG